MNQQDIIQKMQVLPVIDVPFEIQRRVDFIKQTLQKSNLKKLVLGISGGIDSTTCGKLAQIAINQLNTDTSDKYEFIFVFANVGEEHEETLIFADKCDKHFGLNLIWAEPKVIHEVGKGTKHTIVNFETAERSGVNGNFEEYIKKFGIPNYQNMTCTRELKERPITSYARSIGWKNKDYKTAIGIRRDEIDRMSKNKEKLNLFYPLIELKPTTKGDVNAFWNTMPFRLEITGWEGNCKTCWKKSFRKLATCSVHHPKWFEFNNKMISKYEDHVPTRDRNKLIIPIRFFRGNKTVEEIFEIAKQPKFKEADDENRQYDYHTQAQLDLEYDCGISCEPFK